MNGEMTIKVNGIDVTLVFEAYELPLLNDIITKLNEEFGGDENNDSENQI